MGLFDRLFRRSAPPAQAPEPAPADEGPRDLVLRVSNLQGIGRREGQEDSFALLNASDPEVLAQRGLFAVVCDGMGGMEGGREISEGAVDGFLQLFQALNDEGDVPRQLREGTCALSDGLFQRFNGRSGTTAVAVRVFQNALHWISVGDSAIFLRRGGGVFPPAPAARGRYPPVLRRHQRHPVPGGAAGGHVSGARRGVRPAGDHGPGEGPARTRQLHRDFDILHLRKR